MPVSARSLRIWGRILLQGLQQCWIIISFHRTYRESAGIQERKKQNQRQIWEDLNQELSCIEFFPYIQMHEYEALLFSDINGFYKTEMKPAAIAELEKEVKKFPTPEHINNSEQTAPSKRILRVYPYYQKVSDGTIAVEAVGIKTMKEKCLHFAGWVKRLEGPG